MDGDTPKTDAGPSVLSRVDNFVRGVANGMTFGAADYIAGIGDAAINGGGVVDNVKNEIARTQRAALDTPAEVIGGEIVGALAVGAAAGVRAVEGGIAGVTRLARSYGNLKEIPVGSFSSPEQYADAVEVTDALGKRLHTERMFGIATTGAVTGAAALGAAINTTVIEDAIVDHSSTTNSTPPPRVKGPSAAR